MIPIPPTIKTRTSDPGHLVFKVGVLVSRYPIGSAVALALVIVSFPVWILIGKQSSFNAGQADLETSTAQLESATSQLATAQATSARVVARNRELIELIQSSRNQNIKISCERERRQNAAIADILTSAGIKVPPALRPQPCDIKPVAQPGGGQP